jgi:bacteriocin-like protein
MNTTGGHARETKELNGEDIEQTTRELTNDELSLIVGGRKSGESQMNFLIVKMEDIIITS